MNKFLAFTKLIRLKNLIMIALIQVLIKYTLINEYLDNFTLNNVRFSFYLIALTLIVAAGYIINDIYDIETDKINKKENQIIGNSISSKSAFNYYYLLNFLGFLFGFYIALSIGETAFGFIFIFFAFSLWRYSKQHKTSFATGNFQVAFLTALSIINLILFDLVPIGINNENGSLMISKIIIFYAGFSFITTLIREIVKDIEDLEGDQKINALTIAGAPNCITILQLASFPTKYILKRLFSKCTTPVKAIAISKGKKSAKTGIRIVPSPKPEKKVSSDARNAAKQIKRISI